MADTAQTIAGRFGVHRLSFGQLREVRFICEAFGISRKSAMMLCRALRIPLLYLKDQAFFQQFTFEKIIFALTRFNGPGFATPGSVEKSRGTDLPTKLTDDFAAQTESLEFLIEFYLSRDRRDKAGDRIAELLRTIGIKQSPQKKGAEYGHQKDQAQTEVHRPLALPDNQAVPIQQTQAGRNPA